MSNNMDFHFYMNNVQWRVNKNYKQTPAHKQILGVNKHKDISTTPSGREKIIILLNQSIFLIFLIINLHFKTQDEVKIMHKSCVW